MKRLVLGAALAGAAFALLGCPPGGGNRHCVINEDCDGQVCALSGDCVGADEVRVVRVTWRVANQQPTPQSPELCGAISDLRISFRDRDGLQDGITYWPVPCELGSVYYDRVPAWLDRVWIVAFDSTEFALGDQVFDLEGPEITVTPNF